MHAGGLRLDAELVLDRHAAHVVALAQRAVLVRQELGHDEAGDALGAGGRPGRAGQHEVDDVLGHVVLAKDLLATDFTIDESRIRGPILIGDMHTRVARAYEFADLSDYSFVDRLKIRAADLAFYLLINLIGLTARFEVIGWENHEKARGEWRSADLRLLA